MRLSKDKEFEIEGLKVKVTIMERKSNCNGCALKGDLCKNRGKYGIKSCFIGASPIIFEVLNNG